MPKKTNAVRVFDVLLEDVPRTRKEIAAMLHITDEVTQNALCRLKRRGVAEMLGAGRACVWVRVPGATPPADLRGRVAASQANIAFARKKKQAETPKPEPYILDELWPMRREVA